MKNKFFAVIFTGLCFVSSVFAFEGIVEQSVYIESTGQTSNFTWFFKGSNVKMIMKSSTGEQLTLMVNSATNSLILFNEEIEDENGNKLYMELGPEDVKSTIGSISTGKITTSMYNGEESKKVEVLSNGVKYVVEYVPGIDVDFAEFAAFFKESMEVQALAVLGEVGFPVTTTRKDSNGGDKNVVKTIAVKEQVLAESEFQMPAGYKKFVMPAQN